MLFDCIACGFTADAVFGFTWSIPEARLLQRGEFSSQSCIHTMPLGGNAAGIARQLQH
jgi:hypothetical protein